MHFSCLFIHLFPCFSILAEIFSTNDNHSVRSTLQKLPPQYIGSLINELTALMQQKIDK